MELRVPALDYALAAHDAKSDRGKALPVVEALIHNGAEVNFSRWNGWTLLMLAAQNVALGGPELVQVRGADVMESARVREVEKTDEWAYNGSQGRVLGWQGRRLSCWCAWLAWAASHITPVPASSQVLVRQGADVNAKNVRGFTALHLAAECWAASNETCGGAGEGDIVKWLVEEGGADPDIQESAGYTAKSMIQEACLTPLQGACKCPSGTLGHGWGCPDARALCRWNRCE